MKRDDRRCARRLEVTSIGLSVATHYKKSRSTRVHVLYKSQDFIPKATRWHLLWKPGTVGRQPQTSKAVDSILLTVHGQQQKQPRIAAQLERALDALTAADSGGGADVSIPCTSPGTRNGLALGTFARSGTKEGALRSDLGTTRSARTVLFITRRFLIRECDTEPRKNCVRPRRPSDRSHGAPGSSGSRVGGITAACAQELYMSSRCARRNFGRRRCQTVRLQQWPVATPPSRRSARRNEGAPMARERNGRAHDRWVAEHTAGGSQQTRRLRYEARRGPTRRFAIVTMRAVPGPSSVSALPL